MIKKLLISSLLLWGLAAAVNAQEAASVDTFVSQDEQVSAQDLGIGEPTVLPGNPLYFFKNTWRGLQSVLTLDPAKKAELALRAANEKLIEAKKLTEKGYFQRAESHLKNYEKNIAKTNELIEKFKIKNPELAEKFIEKATEQQLKHQALLGKFEKDAPLDAIEGMKKAKERAAENLGQTIGKIEDPQKLKDLVERAIDKGGSPFKPLRNLEVLKALEEKIPEQAKEAIRLAQENAMKRFKNQLETLPEAQKEMLSDYLEKSGGNPALYLKIFDQLKLSGLKQNVQDQVTTARRRIEQAGKPVNLPTKPVPPVNTKTPTSTSALTPVRNVLPSLVKISIKDFAFSPSTVKIAPAGTIIFTNYDSVTHNAKNDAFTAGDMGKNGQSILIMPREPGTYEYHCAYHPSMKGTIIVVE